MDIAKIISLENKKDTVFQNLISGRAYFPEESLKKITTLLNYKNNDDFFYDICNYTETLKSNNTSKILRKSLKVLHILKNIFDVFSETNISNLERINTINTIKENIQELEIYQINRSFFYNYKNTHLNFHYILNNFDKINKSKQVSLLTFISKNINTSKIYYDMDFPNQNINVSFIKTVLNRIKNKNKSNKIITHFYNNFISINDTEQNIFLNELKSTIHNIITFIPNTDKDKNSLLIKTLLHSNNLNKKDILSFLENFNPKNHINFEESIFIMKPQFKELNHNNFYSLITCLSERKITIDNNTNIDFYLNNFNLDFLYEHHKTLSYKDKTSPFLNHFDTSFLFNIENINTKNIIDYITKALSFISNNIRLPYYLNYTFESNNTPYNQNIEKIIHFIRCVQEKTFDDNMKSLMAGYNHIYVYSKNILINEILFQNHPEYYDINSIYSFIKNNIKVENNQDLIFFTYLSRTLYLNTEINFLKEESLNKEVAHKIKSMFSMTKDQLFQNIYKNNNDFEYSKISILYNNTNFIEKMKLYSIINTEHNSNTQKRRL